MLCDVVAQELQRVGEFSDVAGALFALPAIFVEPSQFTLDVALALVYFTSIWDGRAAGLRRDKYILFLHTYNEACRRFSHILPLTEQERKYLVPMLSIANLYVLNWDLVDFYDTPNQNDDEYHSYINHNIGLVHWIALHVDKLKQWVNKS